MRKIRLSLLLLTVSVWFLAPVPKAEAIDPVTIAILAPVALKVAEYARPYIMKGLASGAKHMMVMGVDLLEFFLLPLGLLQTTLGAPFGFFSSGVKNLATGGVAPFKFAFHALMFPLAIFGLY